MEGKSEDNEKRGWGHPFFRAVTNKPEVIAHRGGAGEWPEETLYAFGKAKELGVDVLELDVRITKDGTLVLTHNETVDDTTNGTGPVNSFTLGELKELDAGYKWTADGGKTFPFRRSNDTGVDIRIATLEEAFRDFGHMRMNIEIKQKTPSIVRQVGEMIRKCGMENKVLLAALSNQLLKDFRAAFPEIATSASGLELFKFVTMNSFFSNRYDIPPVDAVQVGIRYKQIPIPFINKRTVGAARRLEMPIHAWTVNRSDDMRRMLSKGVDGIITDYPTRLLKLLKRIP